MALTKALSKSITKCLCEQLPESVATKFGVNAGEFKTFLDDFLQQQFKKSKRMQRIDAQGNKVAVIKSGYILFAMENRPKLHAKQSNLTFNELTKKIGQMWRELSDGERTMWKQRAAAASQVNGTTTTTTTTAAPAPQVQESMEAPSSGSESEQEPVAAAPKRGRKPAAAPKKTPATKKVAVEKPKVNVTRDAGSQQWTISDTPFAVKSIVDPTVTGRIVRNKVIPLSPADIAECKKNGWNFVRPTASEILAAAEETED